MSLLPADHAGQPSLKLWIRAPFGTHGQMIAFVEICFLVIFVSMLRLCRDDWSVSF